MLLDQYDLSSTGTLRVRVETTPKPLICLRIRRESHGGRCNSFPVTHRGCSSDPGIGS